MLSVVAVCVLVVIPTQRPRSAYLFPMTLFLMCVIASSALALFRGSPLVRRLAPVMPLAMLLLPLCIPSAYRHDNHRHQRILFNEYERLRPFAALMQQPDTVFLGLLPLEIRNYVALGQPSAQWYDYSILSELKPGEPLAAFLECRNVNTFEVTEEARKALESRHPGIFDEFLRTTEESGWKVIAMGHNPTPPWYLLYRQRLRPGVL